MDLRVGWVKMMGSFSSTCQVLPSHQHFAILHGSPGEENGHGSKIQLVPPVNIPVRTKIGSKMGGAPTPKWYHWF